MKLNLVCFLYALLMVSVRAQDYHLVLDSKNYVSLDWNVFKQSAINYIRFNLRFTVTHLPVVFGFGFSANGSFVNADLVVFEVAVTHVYEREAYTSSSGALILASDDDELDYVKLVDSNVRQSTMMNTYEISLTLERRLDTCNSRNYRIESGTTHLLYFLKNLRNERLDDLFTSTSSRRDLFVPTRDADSFKMIQCQLIKSTYYANQIDVYDARYHFDMLVDRVHLPKKETVYWCKTFKLEQPKFNSKHHIVAYEGVISAESVGIVHHMELFHCLSDPADESKKNYNGQCTSEAKPEGLIQCRKVVAAWAMGADTFVYPSNVGGVIGGSDYSPYMVLEIHYNNPHLLENVVDSSGIRIYYQGPGSNRPLRRYDAGIMELGLEYNSKNSIPPGQSEFHLNGYCLSECTQAGLPASGINVFASQMHTHLTGRKAWTTIIRKKSFYDDYDEDQNEMILLNSDNHYDPMYQEIRMLQKPVQVYPGDSLVHTCVHDTRSRTNMTFGGYGITDEMCVNYIHYYPVSKVEVCKSSIKDSVLEAFFEKMQSFDRADTSPFKTREENFNSIRWSGLSSAVLSKLYDIAPISFSCNSSAGQHIDEAYKQFKNGRVEYTRDSFSPIPIWLKDYVDGKYLNAPLEKEYQNQCNNNRESYFD